ncbi:hypothetical protein CBF36_08850 [Vagococcus bubulae]|uniref:Uncharacterized protein n=1 Tax=Vagococcus bubulae TaxID=1977868 RepID=A0A429ZEU9_9ENTE|nr:hypothetical protein CBF36_08850 [Vagococcus bubulae]
MKSEYHQILFLSLIYSIIYFLSLIFATGHGIGFKFDDNQAIAYILVLILFSISISSFKIKDIKQRHSMVKFINVLIILFIVLFLSGIVGSNEAMFIFIFPIFIIPIFIFIWSLHYLTFNKKYHTSDSE